MFKTLVNKDIEPGKLRKLYEKTVEQLANADFASAEVKKMPNHGYYRAKIDYENRLVFKFGSYHDQTCLLILEIIFNHDYQKSRFLRGVKVDESKLLPLKNTSEVKLTDIEPVRYINPQNYKIHFLDKVLSFDDFQHQVIETPLPQIIIGSAGSGKTALTLEKIKALSGKVLYVSLSPYLVENSSRLFYSFNYENDDLDVDFLSFREFIESLQVPSGKELDYRAFEHWFDRYRQATKLKDAHKTFEEFRGVITGLDIEKEMLTRDNYLNLGVKQSIFLAGEREMVYNLFEKYLTFLKENNFYDINILSHQWLKLCQPVYDYIIIDEVQDFTNIQLHVLLHSLKKLDNFMLCGDANQVVHPNFFSWAHLKSMFYKNKQSSNSLTILQANYRNSKEVSELANRLLKIKIARFGSIDKESNYLVKSSSDNLGSVIFAEDKGSNVADINRNTKLSANYAVIVMRDEDKAKARSVFQSPLLFSVQESKGLEYENIILFNFLTDNFTEFNAICEGVTEQDITNDELNYSRAKDKTDKSSEVYKFYINSLYVAITRAVKNVYMIEQNKSHKLFGLLGLVKDLDKTKLKQDISSSDDWKREARRLEMQGKTEQADAIRQQILQTEKPNWEVITNEVYQNLKKEALNPDNQNHKAKVRLFDFALAYNHHIVMLQLAKLKFSKAENYDSDRKAIFRKYYPNYYSDNVKMVVQNINKYGIDYRDIFNFTPLHVAVMAGAGNIVGWLLQNGANPALIDTFGKSPLQTSLMQAFVDKNYALNKLGSIYPHLVYDALKIQVEEHLIKIDPHKIEFFLINFFLTIQSVIVQKKKHYEAMAIKIDDIIKNLQDFSEVVLPEFRKRREYLQPQLGKHEVSSTSPYNKKLFKRMDRGHYILNPDMKIWVNEQWLTVDQLVDMQDCSHDEIISHSIENQNQEFEAYKLRFEKMKQKRMKNLQFPWKY